MTTDLTKRHPVYASSLSATPRLPRTRDHSTVFNTSLLNGHERAGRNDSIGGLEMEYVTLIVLFQDRMT